MNNILSQTKAVIQAQPGHELLEKYGPLLVLGLDKAFQRDANVPIQGESFFRSSTETKGYKKYQAKTGVGLMKQSRDNDALPKTEGGLGFDYELSTVNYRLGISTERELLEKNLYGQLGKEQRELADSAKRTLEVILADVFNRGHGGIAYSTAVAGVGSGASQFICEDGKYFVDAERPNPVASAANWSNRMSDIAWTAGGNNDAVLADLIKRVKLKFKQYRNDRGDLSPMTLKRMIISPVLEDMATRVTSTKLVYSGDTTAIQRRFSDQAVNTISGTAFTVYDWLSDGLIYFEAQGENELELLWRVAPSTMVYTDGNPDMLHQRVRMALGTGCARPTTWIGCLTTGTSNL